MIVDDEVKLTNILKEFLELRQFEVWTAFKGEEAVPLIQAHQPDVLLLDLSLDGSQLQGVEVLKQTRELSPATRIVVMTGYGSEEKKAQVMQLGASHYLEKPLNMAEVLQLVQTLTASS